MSHLSVGLGLLSDDTRFNFPQFLLRTSILSLELLVIAHSAIALNP